MDNVTIRLITNDDIRQFFPQGMRDTCIGWAVDIDGALAAIAGVARGRGIVVAFSQVKDGLNVPKRTLYKIALKINALIMSLHYPVIYALTYKSKLLPRLGWEYVESRGDVEVYRCKRSQ